MGMGMGAGQGAGEGANMMGPAPELSFAMPFEDEGGFGRAGAGIMMAGARSGAGAAAGPGAAVGTGEGAGAGMGEALGSEAPHHLAAASTGVPLSDSDQAALELMESQVC